MTACISEADLLELASGERPLEHEHALESHLAGCAACSALLTALVVRPAEASDRSGTELGPYRLDGKIGAGAMGDVYRAWDARLHRHVALKLLHTVDARRLASEARAAGAIAHRNVVTVFDAGEVDGQSYLVSELVTGESLRGIIERGSLPRTRVVELLQQLADGVAAAHAHGVIHRDLKPSNLLVATDGTLKILDFGLAKLVGDTALDATQPGTVLGTAGYLSPEQARGEQADARSDVFAVGAIGYELLAGRLAFPGATFAERLTATLRDEPPPLADALGPIVARCLAKRPSDRFQTAADLRWALERIDAPVRQRDGVSRRAFVVGLGAMGAGGAALGWLARGRGQAPRTPAYRQLTFRQGRVASARFSPDGSAMIYSAAWDGQPVRMYTTQLGEGGATTTTTLEDGSQLLAISRRGDLALSLGHGYRDGFYQAGELATVPLAGGAPRRLGLTVQQADFTPDGELVVVRRAGPAFILERGGTVLLTAPWISHPRVSPDGGTVACLVHGGPHDDAGRVALVTRTVRTLPTLYSSIDGLAWAPDSTRIWLSASRAGGNNALHAISREGTLLTHIPTAGRLRIQDVAADGRLAITHVTGRLRMSVRPPGSPDELDLALSDVSLVAGLSADGRNALVLELGDVDAQNGAYVLPTDGSPAIRVGELLPWDISSDGRTVLGWTDDPEQLVVAPIAGARSVVALPGFTALRAARWAGETIIVNGARGADGMRWWRRTADGRLAPLSDAGVAGTAAVSPDQRQLAVLADGALRVIAIADGHATAVPGTYPDGQVCGWRDGDVLVRSSAPPVEVRRVSPATGTSTWHVTLAPTGPGLRGIDGLAVAAQADAYAYSYGVELSRLYLMTT